MAKFYGEIGFFDTVEVKPGVYEDRITKRNYYGDVIRNTRKMEYGESVIGNISVENSISIVADAYVNEHFFAIRYICWAGERWTVTNVEVQRPRLVLRLGGIYNGPEDESSD